MSSIAVCLNQFRLVHRDNPLLEVDLELTGPSVTGVVGPKGAGKSLFLAALAERLPRGIVFSGSIEWRTLGEDAGKTTPPNPEVVWLPKHLPGRGSVYRALTHPISPGIDYERRVEHALKKTGLWEDFQSRLSHSFHDLSRTERLMMGVCRSVVRRPSFLLLDDPTAPLDPGDAARFARVVMAAAREVPTVWTSRSLRRVSTAADRLLILRDGKVIADDSSSRLVVTPPPSLDEALREVIGETPDLGLESLYHELLALGSRAEKAVHLAVQSLTDQNLSVAREVVERDNEFSDRKKEIQDDALGLIARTAPVGRELRTLTTVIKAATDLERIADHAINISEVTMAIGEEPLIKPLIDIPRLAERAQAMVRHSLDAMVRRDVALAERVCRDDAHVDALYRELFEELLGFITDGGDSYRAGQALYLLFVARYLERVADHATNIAEHVIFMVEGKHVHLEVVDDEDDFPHTFLPR